MRKNRAEGLEPVLARYGGRLVKLTGDGTLVEFASAVDAPDLMEALKASGAPRQWSTLKKTGRIVIKITSICCHWAFWKNGTPGWLSSPRWTREPEHRAAAIWFVRLPQPASNRLFEFRTVS